MKKNNINKLYSFKSIQDNWGISISMLKKLHSNRIISVVKIGNKNFIKSSDIEEYINKNTIEARYE